MDLQFVIAMLPVVALASMLGLIPAAAVAGYVTVHYPLLVELGARRLAVVIAAAITTALPLGTALLAVLPGAPGEILFVGACLAMVLLLAMPRTLIHFTGGPRPGPNRQLLDELADGDEALAALNFARWRAALEGLERHRTESTAELLDIAKGLARLNQTDWGTPQTRSMLTRFSELRRRLAGVPRRSHPKIFGAVLLAFLVATVPNVVSIAMSDACTAVEVLLLGQRSAAAEETPDEFLPGTTALKSQPEPGATPLYDAIWDLEAAAESRHDPTTRAQLVEAGFVGAHATIWRAADGHQLSADVFVFRDALGAFSFHRHVNRHACQFSNVALRFSNDDFAGPVDGVGLQVRYSSGDPIVEQISWVSGSSRYVVAVGALSPPADHTRVQRLADHVLRDINT